MDQGTHGWQWLVEKILLAVLIAGLGVFVTLYTNDKQMELQLRKNTADVEIETVKYQLTTYLAAPEGADRLAVLHLIRSIPHSTDEMKQWAKDEFAKQQALNRQAETEAALLLIKATNAEQGDTQLTAEDKNKAAQAGAQAAMAIEKQATQGIAPRPQTPRERAKELWAQGYNELTEGNVERAEALYLSSREVDPRYAAPINSLGRVQLDRGNAAAAEKLFRQALDSDPKHAAAAYNLSLALKAQGRAADAKQALGDAIDLNPKYGKRELVEDSVLKPSVSASGVYQRSISAP